MIPSKMFAHYGVTKLSSQQVRGKREAGMSAGPALHRVFWTRVTQYSGRMLFLPEDL